MYLDISKVDTNFLTGSKLNSNDFVWINAQSAPIEVRGLAEVHDEVYVRLPQKNLPDYSEGVQILAWHTAGGHARFATDSKRIAVRAKSRNSGMMSHMPLTGSTGVDVYRSGVFRASIRPNTADGDWFEGVFDSPDGMAEYEINLPLYNGVTCLLIGVEKGAQIAAPRPYKYNEPVLYYGSSITQGGCASRPGNSYQGFLSRWLDADQINLGFSGNGRGEAVMAEYIAGVKMSAFVMDYDHNAPSVEELQRTHEPFFRIIRKANPTLPVVFVSRPDFKFDENSGQRREIIRTTYRNALAQGDEYVWFVDGESLFGTDDRDACTVDGCHPNDLGFYRMAKGIYPALKEALEK